MKHFQPDILFMDDFTTFSAEWISNIRQQCPSIKLVIGWCGAAIKDTSVLRAYDIVLSCVQDLVDYFVAQGMVSYLIHNAFDQRILQRIKLNAKKKYPVSFVGTILFKDEMHIARKEYLEVLSEKYDIKIFSALANQKTERSKKLRNINPPVFGLKMYQTLADSLITFNKHIDLSKKGAGNMRLYEATGVGTCLLTDWKENLKKSFEPDREVATYKSIPECLDKIDWLLKNPEECQKIALAGQKRTLKDHTFLKRAETLDEIIKKSLKN
jgi:spore maturation protein CgeB